MSRSAAVFVLAVLLAIPSAWGQAVISARSGMVNYVEGQTQLAGKPVKLDGAIFPNVQIGETLSTQGGFAEVLLTPGVFLRLGRNSSFRMISNKMTDTQVEIVSGSALIEANEILKDNRIAVKMGDSETVLLKTGLYHFNADAGQVRTFQGNAKVSDASNSAELKGGRTLLVASSLSTDKFDKNKFKDELYAWSEQRDYRLELANISIARGTNPRGLSNSLWAYDPWLSMFTFLPRSGYINNPFGIAWYSPSTVWYVFRPAGGNSNFGGYQGNNSASASSWQGSAPSSSSVAPSSNASTGSVGVSSGSSSSAVAASAGASRGR